MKYTSDIYCALIHIALHDNMDRSDMIARYIPLSDVLKGFNTIRLAQRAIDACLHHALITRCTLNKVECVALTEKGKAAWEKRRKELGIPF